MRNQRMYDEFLELVQTDSASGKEDAIAVKLINSYLDPITALNASAEGEAVTLTAG